MELEVKLKVTQHQRSSRERRKKEGKEERLVLTARVRRDIKDLDKKSGGL